MSFTSERCGRTDAMRFDALARRYYDPLYRYAYSLTRCHEAAGDLTQDALVRAFRRYETYDPSRPFLFWLRRVAYRVFLDGLRLQRPVISASLDELKESTDAGVTVPLQVRDDTYNPEHILMQQTMEEWLEHPIRSLPGDFRDALILCDIEGLSYKEIAHTLGCQVGTVSSRVHRARHLLRQAIGSRPGSNTAPGEPLYAAQTPERTAASAK